MILEISHTSHLSDFQTSGKECNLQPHTSEAEKKKMLWCYITCLTVVSCLKGTPRTKMKILISLAQPYVNLNLYDYLSSAKHKKEMPSSHVVFLQNMFGPANSEFPTYQADEKFKWKQVSIDYNKQIVWVLKMFYFDRLQACATKQFFIICNNGRLNVHRLQYVILH